MIMCFGTKKRLRKRLCALILCLVIASALTLPFIAHAQESEKTVRVGWFESPFNLIDRFGRRSGYGYEYQQKIAAYTGWTYEYAEGSWPELMQMLTDGEIDLLSDVSFTEERTEKMLFPSIPTPKCSFTKSTAARYSSGDLQIRHPSFIKKVSIGLVFLFPFRYHDMYRIAFALF